MDMTASDRYGVQNTYGTPEDSEMLAQACQNPISETVLWCALSPLSRASHSQETRTEGWSTMVVYTAHPSTPFGTEGLDSGKTGDYFPVTLFGIEDLV